MGSGDSVPPRTIAQSLSRAGATIVNSGQKMERASRFIGRLPIPGDTISVEELVRAAWPAAVGQKIAARTRVARMVRNRLIIEVEDATWQRQLFVLTGQILRNLERDLGQGVVGDIEFRIVPLRRGPQRAEQSEVRPETADDADQISDPVLRTIYKKARMKALA